MAVAIALGIGLWLRSFACMVLSALLYPATIAYMKFLGQMDWNPMVLVFFGLPVLLLAFGGLLRGKEEVKRTTDEQ
jgi:hypothetical protein